MEVKLNGSSGMRPAYFRKQTSAPKTRTASTGSERKKDSVVISAEGREVNSRVRLLRELEERCGIREVRPAGEREDGEPVCFGSFLDEFNKLLASGGGENIAVMDMQANQNLRRQMERTVQTMFVRAGVEIPAGTDFRLEVSPGDYQIRAVGLKDAELARKIGEAVNCGDNGRKLYQHVQFCNPARFGFAEPERFDGGDALGLVYCEGRLSDIGTRFGYGPGQTEWQCQVREEPVKAGLAYMEQAEKIAQSL